MGALPFRYCRSHRCTSDLGLGRALGEVGTSPVNEREGLCIPMQYTYIQPDDERDRVPVLLAAMNEEFQARGELGDLDAMEASFGLVAAIAAKRAGCVVRFKGVRMVEFEWVS